MLVSEKLHQFYIQNNLAKDGGEKDAYFFLTFRLFSLKLPNADFRKKVIYMHDIQHILYDKDVTWKGEAFIAGWEIATGLWKQFPIGFMSLWAMGFSLLTYPKEVIKGYKEGLLVTGIIGLGIPKTEILNKTVTNLKLQITRKKPIPFNNVTYLLACILSLTIVLGPLFLGISLLFLFL